MRISSDGRFSVSNEIANRPSFQRRTSAGEWNITNGELVYTDIKIRWEEDKQPRLRSVALDHDRIVRITDQELALALEVNGVYETNFYVTNIFRRAK
jgi:hypothetical protein